jgi:hypothetical protein
MADHDPPRTDGAPTAGHEDTDSIQTDEPPNLDWPGKHRYRPRPFDFALYRYRLIALEDIPWGYAPQNYDWRTDESSEESTPESDSDCFPAGQCAEFVEAVNHEDPYNTHIAVRLQRSPEKWVTVWHSLGRIAADDVLRRKTREERSYVQIEKKHRIEKLAKSVDLCIRLVLEYCGIPT